MCKNSIYNNIISVEKEEGSKVRLGGPKSGGPGGPDSCGLNSGGPGGPDYQRWLPSRPISLLLP